MSELTRSLDNNHDDTPDGLFFLPNLKPNFATDNPDVWLSSVKLAVMTGRAGLTAIGLGSDKDPHSFVSFLSDASYVFAQELIVKEAQEIYDNWAMHSRKIGEGAVALSELDGPEGL